MEDARKEITLACYELENRPSTKRQQVYGLMTLIG